MEMHHRSSSLVNTLANFEAGLLMIPNAGDDMDNGAHVEYGSIGCGTDNVLQTTEYGWNDWNDSTAEDGYLEELSPTEPPSREPSAEVLSKRTKDDDVVKNLYALIASLSNNNKITKRKAKVSKTKQKASDNRLDRLESQITMIMQTLESQAVTIANQGQALAECGEKSEENWEKSEQKYGKHDESLRVAFRLLDLQMQTMAQFNNAKATK